MAYLGRFDGSNAVHASPAMAAVSGNKSGCQDVAGLPTSTKWSVLSSRVEGLVAELSEVVGNMDAYCVSKSNAEGPAMAAVRKKMIQTNWADEWAAKRTMFSYGEEMSTDPLEAMFLKELVSLGRPGRVLEIGMFVGYGAVAMLEGCSSTRVVSLEIDPFLKDWLSSCIQNHTQISDRHEIVVGPALESIPKLSGAFDMVFIDANKAEYKDYVKTILEKNLLAPGGMIVCDNILYNGYPYVNAHFDAQPARRGFGDAIKEFNQWVYEQPELEQILLPVRDGVSFIRRRCLESDSPARVSQVSFAPEPAKTSAPIAPKSSEPPAESPEQSVGYVGRFNGTHSKHASPAMAAANGMIDSKEDVTSLPTSTKWSVMSSRVEGLVAELSQVVGKMDAYCVSKSNAEGPAMEAVRNKMISTPWADEWNAKRTMFSYGEEMSTDPLEAMLLKELVFLGKPKRVLEIGMFVGYGAVAMLEGCTATEVVSLEIDPYLKEWLSSCLTNFPQISKRHDIVVGPALESIPKLTGTFDMIFIDANKAEYKDYVKNIMLQNLLAPEGMIVCDNVLYNGYPYANKHFDAQPARRGFGDAIREFNQWVFDQPELEQIVLPIRDGVSMIRRRQYPSWRTVDALDNGNATREPSSEGSPKDGLSKQTTPESEGKSSAKGE